MTYEEAIDILSTGVMDYMVMSYIPSAATWLMGLHDLAMDGNLEAAKIVIDTWVVNPDKIIDGSEKAHSRVRTRVASKAPVWFEVDEV